MWIRYVGPLGSGIDLLLDDGRVLRFPQGGVGEVPDDLGHRLLDEQPKHWQFVHYPVEGDAPARYAVKPSVLAGRAVRQKREEKHWGQKRLLQELERWGHKRSQAALSRLECGEQEMTVTDLVELACALNVPALRLLDGAHLERPPDVHIAAAVVVSPTHYRRWLAGSRPLPPPDAPQRTRDLARAREYRREVTDRQWLELQRSRISMLVEACRQLVAAADAYREHLPEEGRAAFEEALAKVGSQLDALERSQQDVPSQRPGRVERRGRSRRRPG